MYQSVVSVQRKCPPARGVVGALSGSEVGIAIHAMASDDDGNVTVRGWVWEKSEGRGPQPVPVPN